MQRMQADVLPQGIGTDMGRVRAGQTEDNAMSGQSDSLRSG